MKLNRKSQVLVPSAAWKADLRMWLLLLMFAHSTSFKLLDVVHAETAFSPGFEAPRC